MRSVYSPVAVFMRMRSPVSMNSGVVTDAPVSTVTFLVPPCVVLPRMFGGASCTVRSTLMGSCSVMMVLLSSSAVTFVPDGMRCMFSITSAGIVTLSDGVPSGCITASSLRVYTNTYSFFSISAFSILSDACSVFVVVAPVLRFFMRTWLEPFWRLFLENVDAKDS